MKKSPRRGSTSFRCSGRAWGVWVLMFSYDGSFEGLLSAVFDAYTGRLFPDCLCNGQKSLPLLCARVHKVLSSEEKAGRVARGLARLYSRAAINDLTMAWRSEEPEADMAVFRYIRKGFDAKSSPEHDLADPVTLTVSRLAKMVSREAHALTGFARFQKTAEGIYFSALCPRHNVLELLLPHFQDRFAAMPWIIYDTRRDYGFLHERGQVRDLFLDGERAERLRAHGGRLEKGLLAEDEIFIQDLWKGYFKATAIAERINPRLQRRCMPGRYWRYLTEKQ